VRRSRASLVGLAVVPLAVAGCLPAAVTSEGREVTQLYTAFLAIAGVVVVVVLGLATFAILRYRRRPGDDELPRQVHGNLRYEAIWTGIPLLTIVGLLGATILVLNSFETAVRASNPVEISVTGFRWGWRFEYPGQDVTVEGLGAPGPEVYVPVGEPIRITLTGADVIHAFFVPQFLFKRDAIPGRETQFGFTVDEPGRYGGQCAEFCGIYHSKMPFTVVAVPRAEYDAWLAAHQGASPPIATPEPSPVTPAPDQPAPDASGPYESVQPTIQPSVTTTP
jgi:cytochrome c oxidase subunit II